MEDINNVSKNDLEKGLLQQKKSDSINKIYNEVSNDILRISLANIKFHWLLVILAVFITFLSGFLNEVSFFENLRRCFYAGSIFWVVAEFIDYILKK